MQLINHPALRAPLLQKEGKVIYAVSHTSSKLEHRTLNLKLKPKPETLRLRASFRPVSHITKSLYVPDKVCFKYTFGIITINYSNTISTPLQVPVQHSKQVNNQAIAGPYQLRPANGLYLLPVQVRIKVQFLKYPYLIYRLSP